MSLCQRYYEIGNGTLLCSTSSVSFAGAINDYGFRVVKRTSPTLTVTKTSGTLAGIDAVASVNNIGVVPSSQATDGQYAYYTWTASAEL